MLDIPIKESRLYTEGQSSILVRLLNKKVGELPDEVMTDIGQLSASQLEVLAEAVLDFSGLAELQSWLKQHRS